MPHWGGGRTEWVPPSEGQFPLFSIRAPRGCPDSSWGPKNASSRLLIADEIANLLRGCTGRKPQHMVPTPTPPKPGTVSHQVLERERVSRIYVGVLGHPTKSISSTIFSSHTASSRASEHIEHVLIIIINGNMWEWKSKIG